MIALAFIGQWRKVAGTQESRQEFEPFARLKSVRSPEIGNLGFLFATLKQGTFFDAAWEHPFRRQLR